MISVRESLRTVMRGRPRRLYEGGLASTSFAWSDAQPGRALGVPRRASYLGSYELRWWSGGGEDIVSDAFLFPSVLAARDFFARASGTACHPASAAVGADAPAGVRDLRWRNPDGFTQEDAWLMRGRAVYRVAVVRAGSAGRDDSPAGAASGFALVNRLACALPRTTCAPPPILRPTAPAAPV